MEWKVGNSSPEGLGGRTNVEAKAGPSCSAPGMWGALLCCGGRPRAPRGFQQQPRIPHQMPATPPTHPQKNPQPECLQTLPVSPGVQSFQLRTTNSARKEKQHPGSEKRRPLPEHCPAQMLPSPTGISEARPGPGSTPTWVSGVWTVRDPFPEPSLPHASPLSPARGNPGCRFRSRLTHWHPLCPSGGSSTPQRCSQCLGSCGRDFRSAKQARRHSRGEH